MKAKRILVSVLAVGLGLGLLLTSVVGLTGAQEPGPRGSAARAQGSIPGTVSYQGPVGRGRRGNQDWWRSNLR